MRDRFAWLPAVAIVCAAGCAQMLGLDDYREAFEAGADEGASTGADGPGVGAQGDSSVSDQQPELPAPWEGSPDAATGAAPDESSDGPTEGGADVSDALPEAAASDVETDSAIDRGNLADALDAQTSDALADVDADQQASDASLDQQTSDGLADAPVCPAECNGGCGPNGTVCVIVVTQPTAGSVVCPLGLACQVQCLGSQVCLQPIVCAYGQPCTVVCNGNQACDSNVISGSGASSLCVECVKSGGGNTPGCNAVTCTGTCSIHCPGGCNASCANCAQISGCP